MSLKYALLGLLAHTPRHGYELKHAFETSFSQMRSLNVGQIYTTLSRLEQASLVESQTVEQSQAPARKVYSLTDTGKVELDAWLAQPVEDPFGQARSEVFIKLMVNALVAPLERGMIERQRQQLLASLTDLRQQRLHLTLVLGPTTTDPRSPQEQESSEIRLLLLEGAILHLEADLHWLALIETRLNRLATLSRDQRSEIRDQKKDAGD